MMGPDELEELSESLSESKSESKSSLVTVDVVTAVGDSTGECESRELWAGNRVEELTLHILSANVCHFLSNAGIGWGDSGHVDVSSLN
jgi:hypothetical protein